MPNLPPVNEVREVGRVLSGRYRLIELIGSGASARVYCAEDLRLKREVAVKLLHAHLLADQDFFDRFESEALTVAKFRNANIVAVWDKGEDNGAPYLVLEYLANGSLQDLLDSGYRLNPAQAMVVAREALSGLVYAHVQGVVHRDIKPANLMLDRDGKVKIADFGVAGPLLESASRTRSEALGTLRYASPEQLLGAHVDGRTDVYALGLVMLESVFGNTELQSLDLGDEQMAKHGSVPPAKAEELRTFQQIVRKATSALTAERFDAASMLDELDAALASQPAPAALPGWSGPGWLSQEHPTSSGADLTQHGPSSSGPPTQVLDLRNAGSNANAAEQRVPAEQSGGWNEENASTKGSNKHRRWPWIAAVSVLALVLLGAGVALVAYVMVPSRAVPSLVGMAPARATVILRREHLRLRIDGHRFDSQVSNGLVADQAPFAGSKLRQGSSVFVVISKGPQPRLVPNLAGMSQSLAIATLVAAGFQAHEVTMYSENVQAGTVIGWSPQSGLQPVGSLVTVQVSQGPHPRTVPALANSTYPPASAALLQIGLVPQEKFSYSTSVQAGKVIAVYPASGTAVARGSVVVVEVSKGPQLVTVPTSLFGKSVSQASKILHAAGLSVGSIFGPNQTGPVIYSAPSGDTRVAAGTPINLYTI